MPNITIYLKNELHKKFINSNKELQKEARSKAVDCIKKALDKEATKK